MDNPSLSPEYEEHPRDYSPLTADVMEWINAQIDEPFAYWEPLGRGIAITGSFSDVFEIKTSFAKRRVFENPHSFEVEGMDHVNFRIAKGSFQSVLYGKRKQMKLYVPQAIRTTGK